MLEPETKEQVPDDNREEAEEGREDTEPKQPPTDDPTPSLPCPYKLLNDHWLTLSRPQYQRTCGISSLVSIWNYQFSRLGLGDKDPISIEQAMLKLNLIGNGSVEENMRKRFKKTKELKEDEPNKEEPEQEEDPQISNIDKSLYEYVNSVDFGCFTGNDTLLKWYRLLCRIYGGSGRSYMFYKSNSERSAWKTEKGARKALVEGLNSGGKTCFIYHAWDHYFCPLGYEYIPHNQPQEQQDEFQSSQLYEDTHSLNIFVGESSKMFNCIHSFKWKQIQLDLHTYWPQKFNIRRRSEGVTFVKGKETAQPKTSTINCIMAFEKLKD